MEGAPHILDNPLWASLSTRHRGLALGAGAVLRYPAAIAPFLAVAGRAAVDAAELEALVGRNETVYLIGPEPSLPPGWRLTNLGLLAQMVCEQALPEVEGPPLVPLTDAHRADVLGLTALVYPHYFRPRTVELGRYFGVLEQGRLAAMIGERMGAPGYREISAVCTHPDFSARGLARRLLAFLSNDNLRRGETPFLHVSLENERAKSLYERNGYRTRRRVAFFSLCREAG